MVNERPTDPVVEEFARQVRERLGTRVRRLVLFGSRARRDHRSDSDYDMLVVVDERSPAVREALLAIEVDILNRFDCLVASLLKSEGEWETSQRLPIGLNVAREGVAI